MTELVNDSFLELLEQGREIWNSWRAENPSVKPVLAGEDLSEMDLSGINFGEVDLSEADFYGSDLSNANLKMANLAGADFSAANLSGAELYKVDLSDAFLTGAELTDAYLVEANLQNADLRGCKLDNVNLSEANLSSAELSESVLKGVNFSNANITGANLSNSNLALCNLIGMEYGSFHSMRGHYLGIRGLESCYGNAIFVRDAKDQDYLDTVEHNIELTPSPRKRSFKRLMFRAWKQIDYGRSLVKPFIYALILATVFGFIYFLDIFLEWGLMDYSSSAQSWFSPFYYSIVTYTTLGFGDITPQHWIGEIIVVTEVILGYTTLGLLLSILANRVARQS